MFLIWNFFDSKSCTAYAQTWSVINHIQTQAQSIKIIFKKSASKKNREKLVHLKISLKLDFYLSLFRKDSYISFSNSAVDFDTSRWKTFV